MKSVKSVMIPAITTICILCLLLVTTFATNNAVNVYSQNELQHNRTCVIIDAGHGGIDGGAISCTGISESNINLEIALRLNDLMHLLGIRTYMIRTEDISVYTEGKSIASKKISDLKERVRIINTTPNAVFVSIHQNYFEDARYCGAQVFYGKDDVLAKQLQEAFVHTLNIGSNRKAKKANGVYLMQKVNRPGALIECGFLSNHAEESMLRDPIYQKKICTVISATVSCYIYSKHIA